MRNKMRLNNDVKYLQRTRCCDKYKVERKAFK